MWINRFILVTIENKSMLETFTRHCDCTTRTKLQENWQQDIIILPPKVDILSYNFWIQVLLFVDMEKEELQICSIY